MIAKRFCNHPNDMKFKLKKRWWLPLVIIMALAAIWRFTFPSKPAVEYTTVPATLGQLAQTVSETGTVKPLDELDLNFLTPGKLTQITVAVGDQVKRGDLLAKVDDADLLIKARQAQANLNVSQARLDKLLAGAAAVDIDVAKANYQAAVDNLDKTRQVQAEAVTQAQKSYDDLSDQTGAGLTKTIYSQSYNNKAQALLTALDNKAIVGVAALDAVKRLTDDYTLKDYLSARNTQYLTDTKTAYLQAANALNRATVLKMTDVTDLSGLSAYYGAMLAAQNLIFKDLNYCFNSLEYSLPNINFTQSEVDAFKTAITTHSANIAAAINALQSAKQSMDEARVGWDNAALTAKNVLNTAKAAETKAVSAAEADLETAFAKLRQVTAPARAEDISLARAEVQQAKSAADLVANQIADSSIIAPIEGVVSQVNYKVGEQTSAAQPAVVLMTANHYEIEIDVSETDITKVRVGNPVDITLDAYSNSVKLSGQVIFIEPAATIISGVTYYKVKIDFVPGEVAVKSGMTATANIKTALKDKVIMVPARAIIDKNGDKSLQILVNGAPQERAVTVGLAGDAGLVEIESGVAAGDAVITYTKNNGK